MQRLARAVAVAQVVAAGGAWAESAPATWSYGFEAVPEGGTRHILTLEAKDTRQRVKVGETEMSLGALAKLTITCSQTRAVVLAVTLDDPLWTPDTGKRWWLFGATVLRARYILDEREPRRIRFEVRAASGDRPMRFGYWGGRRAKEFLRILAPRKVMRLRVPMRLKRDDGVSTAAVYEFAVKGLAEAATAFPPECRP